MTISEMLRSEYDDEMGKTRATLQRVPMDKPDFKPHEKSMPLGFLARHVASLPEWIAQTIKRDIWDLTPADGERYTMPEAANTEELLALFDTSTKNARPAIGEASDERMQALWSLIANGKEVIKQPRFLVVRTMLNHTYHHRAQLGVYLRLNNIPVPSIYGPSADEGSWG